MTDEFHFMTDKFHVMAEPTAFAQSARMKVEIGKTRHDSDTIYNVAIERAEKATTYLLQQAVKVRSHSNSSRSSKKRSA
jgi:hypothetical protein